VGRSKSSAGSIPATSTFGRDTLGSAPSYTSGVIHTSRFINRGAWLFAVVPATLAAVVSSGTAASAPGAATRQAETAVTYRDAVGEDPLAPDISSVVVAVDPARELSFRVNVPNRPTLTDDMRLRIWLDADDDPSTGLTVRQDLRGVDYFILVDRWELGLGVARLFTCTESVCSGGPQVRDSYAAGGSFSISAAELGITRRQRLRFRVESSSGWMFDPLKGYDSTNVHADGAPDQGGFWTFDMRPLVVKSFSATPRTPQAGVRVLSMSAIRTATGKAAAGKVGCVFRIAGARLRPSKSAFVGGRALCVFDIPVSAKTKSFRSSIAIKVGADRIQRSTAGTIR
jgi:hypothetical protein